MILHRRIAEIPFEAAQLAELKEKMLNWSSRFGISLFLDSNGYVDRYGRYECLLAAGVHRLIVADDAAAFTLLQAEHDAHKDWLFGHLCYDLKNVLEPHLASGHKRRHGYRLMQFFVPEVICMIPRGRYVLRIETLPGSAQAIIADILGTNVPKPVALPQVYFTSRLSKDDYLQKIAALNAHIRNGDCYEINFCNEAFAEHIPLNTRAAYHALNAVSPAPFAAFYQDETRTMICASPERFLVRSGNVLRAQPIKGTARRSRDAAEDERLKAALRNSEKEQAENVMITDLVRNDLARSCTVGSIQVDELFGIYSFPQVHQMISTVRGELRADMPFTDAIEMAFPMGSMTGAPKHRVMQLIEQYEVARRELFSGSVGYISPDGDFDFNVVIRSLFYNTDTLYLSYQTGGAITWGSDAKEEWAELRLKAKAIERIFSN